MLRAILKGHNICFVEKEEKLSLNYPQYPILSKPGRVAQSVGHLTHKSEVLGLISGLATYFHFSFC